jgi:hypothetical protein
VAVGDRQDVEEPEQATVRDGFGDLGDDGSVVQVTTCGGVDEQEMVTHECGSFGRLLRFQPDPAADRAGQLLAGNGVIYARTLADVVQQGAEA